MAWLLEFRLLGPVEAVIDGRPVALLAAKPRAFWPSYCSIETASFPSGGWSKTCGARAAGNGDEGAPGLRLAAAKGAGGGSAADEAAGLLAESRRGRGLGKRSAFRPDPPIGASPRHPHGR